MSDEKKPAETPEEAKRRELEQKKADLLKAHAVRAASRKVERLAADVACLELEAKLAAEHGKEGVDFAIVFDPDLGDDGLIAVKLGSDLAFRKYIDAVSTAEGGVDAENLFHFTAAALVHPSVEQYTQIIRRRGFLANRTADALASLHRVRAKKIEGKF